ncbi:TPA: hypothetical protein HA265_00335 [Candidatus Woesearchaeota archaeon]|nr:hypothetical protein [Candidatus Woesearchaeota archaeon]
MISKIKDLMDISQKLDEINTKVTEHSETVDRHSSALKGYKDSVETIRQEMLGVNKELGGFTIRASSLLEEMEGTNESMKKELYELKLVKTDMRNKLVDELTEIFREELRKQTRQLERDVQSYNKLKEELSRITIQLGNLESEMGKFRAIAQQLKATDFELAKYAREVCKADGEKLKLMKDLDNLQRLLSKERRQRSNIRP